ncbi:MAG: relaxase/mobilization nuclease domain-containing protein [Endozoicomonas sp. (ex Botrylloides leachii)]|nr:relaxase/mobilization nuclease domain-containing protein [Endozoicomonas sp. (ex Botrylloides leachii)]
MIVKKIGRKAGAKSSYSDLIKYLIDDKGIKERVGAIKITHCHSESLDWAVREIEAVQQQNTRAKSDKTYHLLFSFAPGEHVATDTLEVIENRLCGVLGFSDYQRVSVAHGDTDALHVHIAINKIHPKRLTLHEPYLAYKTLSKEAAKIEREYTLQVLNRGQGISLGESLAADMEHHSGTESLVSWMKRECLNDLQAADSWEAFQGILSNHKLFIKKQGNGFVFVAQETSTIVKASSVSRLLSKQALEKRLGGFQEVSSLQEATTKKSYQQRPLQPDTTALYLSYKEENAIHKQQRQQQISAARSKKNKLIAEAKEAGRLKRLAIKLMAGRGLGKRALYLLASRTLKAKVSQINNEYHQSLQQINKKNTALAWADWLKKESDQGNAAALEALRHRKQSHTKVDSLSGDGQKSNISLAMKPERTTKSGTVLYRSGEITIRDTGQLVTATHWNDLAIKSALTVVTNNYGGSVVVNGSPAFQKRIVTSVVKQNISVTFKAPYLEKLRLSLRQKKENSDDRPQERAGRARRSSRRSLGCDGAARGDKEFSIRARRINKPRVARIGTQPPPASQNRLRELPQLGVVQLTNRSEVLLSGHVSSHMEQQRTQSNNIMRRDADRARTITPEQAVQNYVKEREEKRQSGIAILPHKAFVPNDKGKGLFQGVRRVFGQTMALVKKDNAILVVPLTQYGEKRIKSLKKGEPVSLDRSGKVLSRSRGR